MKPLKLLIALSCVGALATAGVAFGQSAHSSGASVIVKTSNTKYGTILVTSSGLALYLDKGDKPPHFACTGGCLSAWPPLKATGTLKAQGAAKASNLSSVKGPGGKMVTYKGHPLYTFASDSKGKITGEGVNGFYVVSPNGSKITKAVQTTTTTSTSSSSSGGYKY